MWWKSAVFYQIYPRSFADTNGDGVGDLDGITRHLDYLEWLGIDAIWISPFFPSPMKDFGYDVSNYTGVDPLFGSLEDFDRLVEQAHRRGIKVTIDWVPNHTSDQHPWFVEARSSRGSPKRDWYIWKDGNPNRPPNNWRAAFLTIPAWTWDKATKQWYLHLFLPEQPDLNWRNPEVVEAMQETLRYWLDRGVDGFRIDVVHGLVKDADFKDLIEDESPLRGQDRFDEDAIHGVIRGFRKLLDSYPGDRMMVGEVFILSTGRVARFYGQNDELHLAFNFPPLFSPWDDERWRRRIERVIEEMDPIRAWPCWVLSNHDVPRHRTRYGSDERARAAAVLLLTLRGTPYLYAGEELGLENARIPRHRRVDPGDRDGCRAPLPWDGAATHGWGTVDPWLPWPPHAKKKNVEAERADHSSMLHLYKRLIAARRGAPSLQVGDFEFLPSPDGSIGYVRKHRNDRRAVFINFNSVSLKAHLDGEWEVEVSSDGQDEGSKFGGGIGPDQAVILRPL